MSTSMRRLVVSLVAFSWLAAGCGSSKKVDLGGECSLNTDCNSPLVCTFGKCHTACEETRDCAPGQSCVNTAQGGVCQSATEAQCDASTGCAGGLVCAVDNRCRAACNSDGNCRPGQKCAGGVCADSGELDPSGQLPPNPNPRTDGGAGPAGGDAGGSSACQLGPGGYCWSLFADPGATSQWVTPPTTQQVRVSSIGATDGTAGMVAELNKGLAADLSSYNQLWFDATATAGVPFTVGLENTDGGECDFNVVGSGSSRYTVELGSADYCSPALSCGFDRSNIARIRFSAPWWGYSLDMTLTNLGLSSSPGNTSGITLGRGATTALNGWCWSLIEFGECSANLTASWQEPPSSNQVHVAARDASSVAEAGIMVELPVSLHDLSRMTYLDFDAIATVTGGRYFQVSLRDANPAGAAYNLAPAAGTHTYSLPLASPTYTYTAMGHAFDRTRVLVVEFSSPWDTAGDLDLTITRLAFR